MLAFKLTAAINASYNNTKGLVSGTGSVTRTIGLVLTDGTAAGQADGLFTADTSIDGGAIDTYFLFAGLRDLYGDVSEFAGIKTVLIEADPTNTAPLIVGGGTWPAWFGDPSFYELLYPGDSVARYTTSANGWPVADGADELVIRCDAAALYKLTIVGISSVLSAPAAAVHPAIVGIPRVGTPTVCSDGSWSGYPVLSYQWRRAGQVITGATGATYTPVAADLNKALTRTTTAANIAGTGVSTTSPIAVQAGQAPVSDLDLTSGATRLSALGL